MSITKKVTTITKNGIEPIIEGYKNKLHPNTITERNALKRASICVICPKMLPEPVGFLAIKDKVLPEVSNMMCEDCGCAIPLKIRQDLEICKHWKE